jgi:hypothetical protein
MSASTGQDNASAGELKSSWSMMAVLRKLLPFGAMETVV